MINDNIALIKSTPRYTEIISSPANSGMLIITACNDNQFTEIRFPVNPLKDSVITGVTIGDSTSINAIIKDILNDKNSIAETEGKKPDLYLRCSNDKETPDASMLAIEEVLRTYPSAIDNFALDYSNIFSDFTHLRQNKIDEYIRDIDGIDNELFRIAVRNMCNWFMVADIRNVRDLIRACKVYDLHFCKSVEWLLTEMECWPRDTVGKFDPSNTDDRLFKEFVVDSILARYVNKRVPVYKLIAEMPPIPDYTYSAEIFKYKLGRCGVDFCCYTK